MKYGAGGLYLSCDCFKSDWLYGSTTTPQGSPLFSSPHQLGGTVSPSTSLFGRLTRGIGGGVSHFGNTGTLDQHLGGVRYHNTIGGNVSPFIAQQQRPAVRAGNCSAVSKTDEWTCGAPFPESSQTSQPKVLGTICDIHPSPLRRQPAKHFDCNIVEQATLQPSTTRIGIADMSIFSEISPQYIAQLADTIRTSKVVVSDAWCFRSGFIIRFFVVFSR